jgi:Adenylate cyclase, class 2 (thermophilic)
MSKVRVVVARLRTEDGRHLFTLKKHTDDAMACLEFESEVADRDQMDKAIQHMGFCPTVRIVKTRRTGRLDDMSLCLDDIDGVGVFFEIEKVVGPERTSAEVQAELDAIARSFGVRLERVTDTYDSLIREVLPRA